MQLDRDLRQGRPAPDRGRHQGRRRRAPGHRGRRVRPHQRGRQGPGASCSRSTPTTPTPTACGSPASSAPVSRTCSRCSPTCWATSKARTYPRAERLGQLPRQDRRRVPARPAQQGRPHPGEEPAVQHRPEGHPDRQGPDRRPAQGVRQGLRREPRLLRQPGPRRPLRARPRQPRPVRGLQGGLRAHRRHRTGLRDASRAPSKARASTRRSPRSTARTADGIITQYSASYSVSIEDFADEVKAWLDKQGDPAFRLNFFVDEVGQFIGSRRQADAQPADHRRVAQHQVLRPGVGVRDLPGGHGEGRRRPHQAAGQRLLQDPGPVQDPPEADQRRRRGGHPQASAGEERRGRRPR